ncbi:hypothetical protein MKX01_028470 [Papaver californicum]|nr:hypothetical protein MKX01_028470 [Papaver californicum]
MKFFYKDDWLYIILISLCFFPSISIFVYDRNQKNVWTTGAGRYLVPLNVAKHYYFISGHGFCYGRIKLAVHVINPPAPPKAAPVKNHGAPLD